MCVHRTGPAADRFHQYGYRLILVVAAYEGLCRSYISLKEIPGTIACSDKLLRRFIVPAKLLQCLSQLEVERLILRLQLDCGTPCGLSPLQVAGLTAIAERYPQVMP